MSSSENNKRIAKNTLMLYFRMLLIMFINLYTSRVILNILGVKDYGLYSVVGSVVIFLGFINISMAAASERFLAFSKGKDSDEKLNSTFSSVFLVQLLISLIILIIGETAGVVYIQNFLNVDPNSIISAHIVYQFSLFTFIIKTLTVPYTASIIANEKMSAFAMISIIEVSLQLAVVLLLKAMPVGNKLITYAIMTFVSVFVIQLCYRLYSIHHFKECRFKKNWNKSTVNHIFSYSGWNLLGALSAVGISQGVNLVLNSFFGVIVNAARGIAFQVSGAIAALSGNYQQAMNPQIVKSYAVGDNTNMIKLIMNGTKFSFYLLLMLSIPVFFNMHSLLELWLGNVPEYTEMFCKLVLINSLITSFSNPLLMGAMATGNIKKYQIIVASINMLNIPASIIALKIYPNPYITMYVMISISIIAFLVRLIIVSSMINMSKLIFFHKVLLPTTLTIGVAIILVIGINNLLDLNNTFPELILKVFIGFILSLTAILSVGLTWQERNIVFQFIKQMAISKT